MRGLRLAAAVARFDRIDALMLGLVATWGSAFVALRALAPDLDPFQLTWYRYILFPVVYGAWLLWRRRERIRTITGADWIRIGALGSLAVIGYHFPLNIALHGYGGEGITAATGSIIVATVPLWTTFVAVLAGKETLRMAAVFGSAIALAGVAIVATLGVPGAELRLAKLAALALLAPMSWAVYGVFTKPIIKRYGGLTTTGLTMSIGTLALLPLGAAYGIAPLRALDGAQWAWLAFLAILSTIAGYAVYNHALKHRDASEVAVYIYLNPVAATLVGWLALGERVTWWFFLGALLVVLGVLKVNHSRAPRDAQS